MPWLCSVYAPLLGSILWEPQSASDNWPTDDTCSSSTLRACVHLCSSLPNSPTSQVRNMRRGGLLFLAPPCSTWIFLNLSWHSVGRFPKKASTSNQYREWSCPIWGAMGQLGDHIGTQLAAWQRQCVLRMSLWCAFCMCFLAALRPSRLMQCNWNCFWIVWSSEDILCPPKGYPFRDRTTHDQRPGLRNNILWSFGEGIMICGNENGLKLQHVADTRAGPIHLAASSSIDVLLQSEDRCYCKIVNTTWKLAYISLRPFLTGRSTSLWELMVRQHWKWQRA